MKTTWIIGGDPGCDLVIDLPSVSRRHCRLTRGLDGSFSVLDLGSTNGTFVNGLRASAETPVGRGDVVTLGLTVPMPWPAADVPDAAPPGATVFRVGREPDNDLVIDSPEVSGHHARVLVTPGARQGFVDDLGSTNGTAVGEHGPRVTRTPITPGDVIYFGPVAVQASRFFDAPGPPPPDRGTDLIFRGAVMTVGRDPACDRVFDLPVVSNVHARLTRSGRVLTVEDLGSSNGTYVNDRRVEKTATVSPGDLIGFGSCVVRLVDAEAGAAPLPPPGPVGSAARMAPSPEGRGTAGSAPFSPSPVLTAGFCLGAQSLVLAGLVSAAPRQDAGLAQFTAGVAVVWVGLCAAFFERLISRHERGEGSADGSTPGNLARALARTGLVTLACTLPLFSVVPRTVPDPGHWPAAFGVLGLTALVGAGLGRSVVGLSRSARLGVPVGVGLLAAVFAITALPLCPPPVTGPVVRSIGLVTPTRWCVEALALLSAGENAEGAAVASWFPAESDRYGTPACTVALLAMLGGLLYADAVSALTGAGRPRPAAPASR